MKSKIVLIIISLLLKQSISWSQTADSIRNTLKDGDTVSFITIFDKKNASKDGYYYLNGYVVNIKNDLVQKIHLKKIKVTGKVTLVKGLKHEEAGEIKQGRYEDTKHIYKPNIEIIN